MKHFLTKKKLFRIITTILITVLAQGIFLFLLHPREAKAGWYDDSYAYRQSISFTHNADISTERRITITADTATLISANKMQSDCDDTRFTDGNGKVLRYQLTGTCNNAATTYDVVFPSVINGSNSAYVYYGNPAASSKSDNSVASVTSLTPSGSLTVAREETQTSPILSWGLDEGYSSSAYDQTGRGVTGSISGAAWKTEDLCVSGKCLYFDGSNDVVTGASTVYEVKSVSFWVRPMTTSEQLVDLNGTNYIETSSGTLSGTGFTFYVNGVVSTTITANRWQHVVATRSTGVSASALKLAQISTNYGQLFMDEFQLYSTELTVSQIKSLYNSRGGGLSSVQLGAYDQKALSDGLVGYWKMDESSGNASDYAGSGNSLINNGTTTYLAGQYGNGSEHVPASSQYFSAGGSQVDTYYFDASDAGPTDSGAAWNNDSSAFDGSTSTHANTSTEDEVLSAEGTNAPGSGGNITQVRARSYIFTLGFGGTCILSTNIMTNGAIESLGATSDTGNIEWGAYTTLSSPLGGWSWAGLQSLEIFASMTAGTGNCIGARLYRTEIEVTSSTSVTLNNLQTISFWANPDSTTNYFLNLISSASISATSGTLSATGFTNPKIYVNGTETSTIVADQWQHIVVTTDTPITADQLYAGRVGSNYYDGTLDEVRLYNRTLSAQEVVQLYEWAPGPVGYWKMDEGTGIYAYDTSSYDNTATLTNSPSWSTGKFGKGIAFGGSNQHLTRADDSDFDFADDADMSISTWFKHTAASSQEVILSKFNEAGYKIIMESDGDITCALDYDPTWTPTDSVTSTAATYDDNKWHYISCVKSGASSLSLYIDGILIGADSSLTATNTLTNADPLYIGIDADGTSNDFTGQLDDIKIYNYARTPKQIIEDMNAGHPLVGTPVAGPVGHWKFDEGALNTCSGGTNDYCDTTPNTNDLAFSTTSGGYSNDGKFGKAFYGGDNRRASLTDDSDFDFSNGTDDFSISAWFNRSAVSNQEYLVDKHSSNDGFTLYMDSDGDIVCGIGDGTSFPEDTAGTTNANYDNSLWHHAVCVKSGTSSLTLYVDGKQVAQDASLGANGDMSNGGDLYIGDANATDGTDEWLGLIDEVKIYRVALTSSDVQLEYNQGKSIVLGALSTSSDGITASNSASRAYCVPGDTGSCSPPVVHWELNENNGASIRNSIGNEYTATLMNNPTWSNGVMGSGLNFDGVDDYVNASPFTIGQSDSFTVSLWLNTTTNNKSKLYSERSLDLTKSMYFAINENATGDIEFGIRDGVLNGNINISNIYLQDGIWHAVTLIQNSKSLRSLYIDGSYVDSSTTTIGSFTLDNLNIGRNVTNSDHYDGSIDDIRIYDYARTPSQIAWDYSRGAPVIWYKYDECSGITAYDASPNNNYDATIYPVSLGNTAVGICGSNNSVHMWNDGTIGKYSSSLGFDGTDDYAATGNISPLAATGETTTNLSWGGWVLASSSAVSKHIIHKQNEFQLITDASSKPNCNIYYSSAFQTSAVASSALTTGTWTHLLCTYDGSNVKLYVNGRLDSTSSTTSSITTTDTTALNIGRNSTGANFFQGLLDDIRVYNYPLTAVQTRTLYNENVAVRYGQ